jgi:hypothetical protein
MPVSMRGVLLSTDIEEDDTKMKRKAKKSSRSLTPQRKARAGAAGETDSRYAGSMEVQPIAGAVAEAAPPRQMQDPQQMQEQREVARGSVTSSASQTSSDEEQEDAKARQRRKADARYREQREQQLWS